MSCSIFVDTCLSDHETFFGLVFMRVSLSDKTSSSDVTSSSSSPTSILLLPENSSPPINEVVQFLTRPRINDYRLKSHPSFFNIAVYFLFIRGPLRMFFQNSKLIGNFNRSPFSLKNRSLRRRDIIIKLCLSFIKRVNGRSYRRYDYNGGAKNVKLRWKMMKDVRVVWWVTGGFWMGLGQKMIEKIVGLGRRSGSGSEQNLTHPFTRFIFHSTNFSKSKRMFISVLSRSPSAWTTHVIHSLYFDQPNNKSKRRSYNDINASFGKPNDKKVDWWYRNVLEIADFWEKIRNAGEED
ncbi:hypothetical protein OSB04_025969 [Centaurea solstitialis]|uniref:Uncharacterized protein n=1 Tax=Centaurea solstitialis TaxID=347529 RepID=A0AA38W288_9ASTR|nr:hypothetical protein OSB04_025969 [Centaurea solstitialis]